MCIPSKLPSDAGAAGDKTLDAFSYSLQEPTGKALFLSL